MYLRYSDVTHVYFFVVFHQVDRGILRRKTLASGYYQADSILTSSRGIGRIEDRSTRFSREVAASLDG